MGMSGWGLGGRRCKGIFISFSSVPKKVHQVLPPPQMLSDNLLWKRVLLESIDVLYTLLLLHWTLPLRAPIAAHITYMHTHK